MRYFLPLLLTAAILSGEVTDFELIGVRRYHRRHGPRFSRAAESTEKRTGGDRALGPDSESHEGGCARERQCYAKLSVAEGSGSE
jgi:hypothetical protein